MREVEGQGRAKFNFTAQTPMELSLIKGIARYSSTAVINNLQIKTTFQVKRIWIQYNKSVLSVISFKKFFNAQTTINSLWNNYNKTVARITYFTDKKKRKLSSYVRKFRRDRLQSHIHEWLTASSYIVKYLCISSYIRKPLLICNRSHLNFLICEENFLFFFIVLFFKTYLHI